MQGIVKNWVHFYYKLNKIIYAQIPYQYAKTLGRNIDDVVEIYILAETEPNFFTPSELKEDFKSRFISTTYINQPPIDKYCMTSPDSLSKCTTCLTALDSTIKNPTFYILTPRTNIYLKFTISNGKFHSTH